MRSHFRPLSKPDQQFRRRITQHGRRVCLVAGEERHLRSCLNSPLSCRGALGCEKADLIRDVPLVHAEAQDTRDDRDVHPGFGSACGRPFTNVYNLPETGVEHAVEQGHTRSPGLVHVPDWLTFLLVLFANEALGIMYADRDRQRRHAWRWQLRESPSGQLGWLRRTAADYKHQQPQHQKTATLCRRDSPHGARTIPPSRDDAHQESPRFHLHLPACQRGSQLRAAGRGCISCAFGPNAYELTIACLAGLRESQTPPAGRAGYRVMHHYHAFKEATCRDFDLMNAAAAIDRLRLNLVPGPGQKIAVCVVPSHDANLYGKNTLLF